MKPIISRHITLWLHLAHHEKLLYANVLLALWSVRIGLWIFPFQRLQALIERRGLTLPKSDIPSFVIAQCVARMARYVPSATCLTQSLVLIVLLKKQGILGVLRLGVSKNDQGRFLAHAWVETLDGVLLSAHDSQGFLPLAPLGSPLPPTPILGIPE